MLRMLVGRLAATPMHAIGGEKSFGPGMVAVMRIVTANVEEKAIRNSGHRLMEEQPEAMITAMRVVLDAR
jgi:pimeloyl-ACP methyl ester carboxylesterase